MTASFYSILTEIGLQKIADALADETTVSLTEMALGDGNGSPTTPNAEQTALVHEVFRDDLSQLSVDPDNSAYVIAEMNVPAEEGPFTVREVGIFDADGDLIAIANFPETYKPIGSEGSTRDLVVRIYINVANPELVELVIDPSVVLANKEWVLNVISNIELNDNGPSVGPIQSLIRNSSSPAVSDTIGAYSFKGKNSSAETVEYGSIRALITSPTDGAEGGKVIIAVANGIDGTSFDAISITKASITLSTQLISSVANGTAPFPVTSTTKNTNFNADLLDDQEGSYYVDPTNLSAAVPLNKGGSNAALTASNGGIVYSTSSAFGILSGTATANRVLLSGASTTPAWSTATYPATTTINRLLYSSANNVISELATGNNGVLVTNGSGVPSISSTLPAAVQANITSLGTLASQLNISISSGSGLRIFRSGTNNESTIELADAGSGPGSGSAGRINSNGNTTSSDGGLFYLFAYNWRSGGQTASASYLISHEGASSDDKSCHIWTTHNGSSLAERMRLNASGFLGLGGTPTRRLYVQGASGEDILASFYQPGTGGSGGSKILIQDGNTGVTDSDGFRIGLRSGSNAQIINQEAALLELGSGNAVGMTFDATNNVTLIGTVTISRANNQLTLYSTASGGSIDSGIRFQSTATGTTSSDGYHAYVSGGANEMFFEQLENANTYWFTNGALAITLAPTKAVTFAGVANFADAIFMSTASSRFVPGATSLSFRNNANSADNLLIADNGNVSVRNILYTPFLGIGRTISGAAKMEIEGQNSTTLGTSPDLWIEGGGGGTNELTQLALGYAGASTAGINAPVIIGSKTVSASVSTKADFYVATRDVTTNTAPVERFFVRTDGTVDIRSAVWIQFAGVNTLFSSAGAGFFLQQPDGSTPLEFRSSAGSSLVTIGTAGKLGFGAASLTGQINLPDHTTAAGGFYIGSDVTLYRSAANVLKTDDALVVALGIDPGAQGQNIGFKRVQIGDWNMDSTSSVGVALGVILASVLMVHVEIFNDSYGGAGSAKYDLLQAGYHELHGVTGQHPGTLAVIDLYRTASGFFDNTSFDSTSFNRGYVDIWFAI